MIPIKSNQYASMLTMAIKKKQMDDPKLFRSVIEDSFLFLMTLLIANPNAMSNNAVNIIGHKIGHLLLFTCLFIYGSDSKKFRNSKLLRLQAPYILGTVI